MLVLVAIGLLFALLGIMIRYLKWYWLISGYNTMSRERKKQVNIEGLGIFMGNCLLVIAGIQFLGALLIYLQFPAVSWIILGVTIAVIIFLLIRAQQYDAGARHADGTLKNSTKIILGAVFFLFAVIGIFILVSSFSTEVVIQPDSVQIKGLYGVEIIFSDIADIVIQESIPSILSRTNGFNVGSVMKGHFRLEDIDRARLYVNVKNPPFIYIYTVEGLIILNQDNRQNTEDLYRVLSEKFR